MRMTFNDRLLITASEDGTLIVWLILNTEGKTASVDPVHGSCVDVIVPRHELVNKIEQISNLKFRLSQIADEFEYRMSLSSKRHAEELEKVRADYEAVGKQKDAELEACQQSHSEDMNIIKATIDENKAEYTRRILQIEQKFDEKIIVEFNKSAELQRKMDSMRDEYEMLLRKSSNSQRATTEVLEESFRKELDKHQKYIRVLLGESEKKKEQFAAYCKQLDADFDRQMIQVKSEYEGKLQQLMEDVDYWRTNTSVMDIKIKTISANCEELQQVKSDLLQENAQHKLYANQLEQNILELQREIGAKGQIANDKTAKFEETLQTIKGLENGRIILNERLDELRDQIGPLKDEIRSRVEHVVSITADNAELKVKIDNSNVQIDYLQTKYRGAVSEIKAEREKHARTEILLDRVFCDLYTLAAESHDKNKLRQMVSALQKK